MSVPGFQKTLLPILKFVSDDQPHRPAETLAYVQTQFDLTEEDLTDRLPNGRTRLMDRVLWAITYLRKARLIESISRGVFKITERGKTLLAEKPRDLTAKDLERYPEYLEFARKGRVEGKQPDTTTQESPEEELNRIFNAIRKNLEIELLDALKTSSPTFFEKVVVSLLVAMGYGGSIEDAGRTTRRTGDDGIDGVIKEDRLGLDVIHIQAKRWNTTVVGRPEIQSFAGSLEGQRGKKGVFITTSSFSGEARDYVSRIEKKIILIDGAEFARLCVDFGIGVQDRTSYIVKKIDPDFFDEG
ncbi:MAG: restriction endonuclease [Silvibacterium sp.]|nr:restriction endonuclease [Silvibacterium sp.]